jgi:long-chain fatty acid transport protein
MKSNTRRVAATLLAAGLFACSGAAVATNGYFTHGVGTESKGMGGSGVASPENLGGIAAATNPALAVFSDEKWQFGLAVFSPMRSYTASDSLAQGQQRAFTLSTGEYDSDNEAFPIPYLAKNWRLSDDSALTLVFYGRGGMNTEWDSGQTAIFDFGFGPTELEGLFGGQLPELMGGQAQIAAGVDLMQAFLSVNYAWKISDSFAIGFGPVVAIQMFEATGLPAFAGYTQTFADSFPGYFQTSFTECLQAGGDELTCQQAAQGQAQMLAVGDVSSLTNNGHDMSTGYGGAIGIWGGSDAFSYGLAYQSKMSMSEFDDYADLFAQDGGFDIPSTLKAGISFRATDSARINLDIERIGYSDVDSVHNSVMNLVTGCWPVGFAPQFESSGCLGGPDGGGFGWEDMTVYKAGVVIDADDRNTWRFGFSYGEQPIPSSEVLFNILAPGVMEYHMTVGWTSERSNGNVMSWSLMYAPSKEITGASTFDPTQTIKLEMSQLELEFAYRF